MRKNGEFYNAGETVFHRWGKQAREKLENYLKPNDKGYYVLPVDGGKYWTIGTSVGQYGEFELKYKKSNSIEELQRKVRQFIDKYTVRSSEWEGGQVYDLETHQLFGFVAYNGKFFDKENGIKLGLK